MSAKVLLIKLAQNITGKTITAVKLKNACS